MIPTDQSSNQAPTGTNDPLHVIDEVQGDMRGPGTALGLGHALRTILPPSVTGSAGRNQRNQTQDERAEEVARSLAEDMILVFEGRRPDNEERGFVRGDSNESLEAVVLHVEEGLWIARDDQAAMMGGTGWEIEEVESDIASIIAEVLQPDQTYAEDLPSGDPGVPGALYVEDGEVKRSAPHEQGDET